MATFILGLPCFNNCIHIHFLFCAPLRMEKLRQSFICCKTPTKYSYANSKILLDFMFQTKMYMASLWIQPPQVWCLLNLFNLIPLIFYFNIFVVVLCNSHARAPHNSHWHMPAFHHRNTYIRAGDLHNKSHWMVNIFNS